MKFKVAILLFLIPIILWSYEFDVQTPVITRDGIQNELPVNLIPGQPAIPFVPVKLLVPMGEKVIDIEVKFNGVANKIDNVTIPYASSQQPISGAFEVKSQRDESIYQKNAFFPEEQYDILGTQRSKGYDIFLVNIYPYSYNPVTMQLQWNSSFSVNLITQKDRTMQEEQNKMLLTDSETRSRIQSLVHNVEAINSYHKSAIAKTRTIVSESDPYEMIIITEDICAPWFDEFVTWKNNQGITTGVFQTSEIYVNYDGEDLQAMIRNFILDAYTTYSTTATPLKYVLLGGDDEIIPIRKTYGRVGNTTDYTLPSDLYYSNLDGTWDGNGNNIYGESSDDVDMYPEVALGRIPAEEQFEFQNFFNKNYSYVDGISVADDMALMIGENLNNNPLTWGGDYKDEIVPIIDEDVHINTLYDREGTYSSNNVRDAINFGVSIINHMGHSNETMVFGQNSTMAHNYYNTEYGFAYSQGCYPAAFDEATSGTGESVAENLVIASGGLYCFVGNTRYGWYSPGNTNGASQYYDIAFFEALYEQDLKELGNALQYSREELVSEALASSVMRWVFYELVCFGDPSVRVKETNGTYPFLQPVESSYDDFQGDQDGNANPGETINLYVTLENIEGWADANDVYAKIYFEDDSVEIIQDSVYYGSIANGQSLETGSFVVSVPQDCTYGEYEYFLEIHAPVQRNVGYDKTFSLSFDVSLDQANWPYHSTIPFVGNPMILDFDQNGTRDILGLDVFASSYLIDNDASVIDGYNWTAEEEIWRSAALGDITNDGNGDLVVACKSGRVFAIDNTGDLIFDYDDCVQQILTPVICNLAGDDTPEVLSFGLDRNLLAFDNNGDIIDGFPVELAQIGVAEMAAADFDSDGYCEIVMGTQAGTIYMINGDGSIASNFPIDFGSPVNAAPVILDNKNIVFGTSDNKLYIISPEGEILLDKELNHKIAGSTILADFDNDDSLEIGFVTQNGTAYIIEQNGDELPGWPVDFGGLFSEPPLAADINNDDIVDFICLSSQNDMYVLQADGTEFPFSPVPADLSGTTPASIDDIDGDLDYEVISGCSHGIFALDIKLRKGNAIPWRTYRGNHRRTGFYGDNDLLDSNEITTPDVINRLYQNFPNPFNPTTTFAFSLKNTVKSAKIEIFNLKGQNIKTIDVEPENREVQEVRWEGKDRFGNAVASGVYFYQLKADGQFIQSKKCILIK